MYDAAGAHRLRLLYQGMHSDGACEENAISTFGDLLQHKEKFLKKERHMYGGIHRKEIR